MRPVRFNAIMANVRQTMRTPRLDPRKKLKRLWVVKARRGLPRFKRKLFPPQLTGIITKLFTVKPKKPNSSLKKLAKVKLSNGVTTYAYNGGIGMTLENHNRVLVRRVNLPDLPGVTRSIIRGAKAYDALGLPGSVRRQGRSKYGVPRPDAKAYPGIHKRKTRL